MISGLCARKEKIVESTAWPVSQMEKHRDKHLSPAVLSWGQHPLCPRRAKPCGTGALQPHAVPWH